MSFPPAGVFLLVSQACAGKASSWVDSDGPGSNGNSRDSVIDGVGDRDTIGGRWWRLATWRLRLGTLPMYGPSRRGFGPRFCQWRHLERRDALPEDRLTVCSHMLAVRKFSLADAPIPINVLQPVLCPKR